MNSTLIRFMSWMLVFIWIFFCNFATNSSWNGIFVFGVTALLLFGGLSGLVYASQKEAEEKKIMQAQASREAPRDITENITQAPQVFQPILDPYAELSRAPRTPEQTMPVTSTPVIPTTLSLEAELAKLNDMKSKGLIDDEEYKTLRQNLISRS